MEIQIRFFENDIRDAIGGGIYKISVKREDDEKKVLYIGESFSMLTRCAAHLYSLSKAPKYFGFTNFTIAERSTTLIIEVIEKETNVILRKQKEKEYINQFDPISQSGISDRMKTVEEKIAALESFLNPRCG